MEAVKQKAPEKLSQAIFMALNDLALVENDKRYFVNMSFWHTPAGGDMEIVADDVCAVCLAGAVLAKTCKVSSAAYISPYDLSSEWRRSLLAVDRVRIGNVAAALQTFMGNVDIYDCNEICDPYGDSFIGGDLSYPDSRFPAPVDYKKDPQLFKEQMLEIACMLEVGGY